jgi:uncharacterized membrane protein YecN with MAPEG domain
MGSESNSKAKLQSQDNQDRKYVNKTTILSIFTLLCVGFCCSKFLPKSPKPLSVTERIAFALKWQAVSVIALAGGIIWVGITRYSTPAINPTTERGKKYVEIPVRYVTNTTEQYIIHFVGSLVLSTHLSSETVMILPVLSILFLVARLMFAVGYILGHRHRAFGFTVTFSPSILAILYSTYCLLKETFA